MRVIILVLLFFSPFLGFSQGGFTPIFSYSTNINGLIYCIHNDTLTNTTFIGGNFSSVGGIPRNYIAAFNSSTGALLPFNPNISSLFGGNVNCITSIGNKVLFSGNFNTVNSQPRNYFASVNFSNSALNTSTLNIGGSINVLYSDNNKIYLGGAFSSIN